MDIRMKLVFERETKGSVLFKSTNYQEVIQNIYIKKSAFPSGKWPQEIALRVDYNG